MILVFQAPLSPDNLAMVTMHRQPTSEEIDLLMRYLEIWRASLPPATPTP